MSTVKALSRICLLLSLLAGCSRPGGREGGALQLRVTMSEYAADGALLRHPWTLDDRIAVVDLSDGERSMLAPLGGGMESASFLYKCPDGAAKDLFAYYPAEADIRYEDGMLRYEIPPLQDGTPLPLSAGTASGTPGAYHPAALTLKPLYRMLTLDMGRMPYTLKALSLRSADGTLLAGHCWSSLSGEKRTASVSTVRVQFPTPVDCSVPGTSAHVMIADIPLTTALRATMETTEGGNH